jgi:hypothetical protein
VTLLRVIPIDLVSSLTDLLNHNKRLVPLDYPLNARYDVIGYHEEAVSLSKDRLVDPRGQIDFLET